MNYKIIIPGKFPSLNEWVDANRVRKGSWSKGNDMKQKSQAAIMPYIKKEIKKPLGTIHLCYHFYEESTRRDCDNVSSYFIKVFQDSLVKTGLLPDDNQKFIWAFEVVFHVDKLNPRIEVEITELTTT